jgi:leader peptidase (prepilin peptidase)/N-methyltransferase
LADLNIPFSFFTAFGFVFGALFGSFANVIIYRLPRDESIVHPRSHCYHCKKPIAWFDNIPLFAWFWLKGRCRNCHTPYSFRYVAVEWIMAILFAAVVYKDGLSWNLLEHLIFAFGLVTASVIDLDHMILPDEFTLGGLILGLIGAAINPDRSLIAAVYGVLFGGGFLWAIAAIYSFLRKQEGMGGGDIKLLAWIGAILGWTSVPFVIISSSLVGSLVGLLLMAKNRKGLSQAIPFGPYLAFGAILYLFFGRELSEAYVRLFIPAL